jgi:putative transport protein
MLRLLIDNPLILLFTVAAIGYPLGRIKIRGTSFGVAAVLFVGIIVGAFHPDLKLPEIIYVLGLVIFVYTIGLSSGAGFFASFRSKGLRDNLLVAGVLVFAGLLTLGVNAFLHLPAAITAGIYAGSLTNTPALAAVMEYVKSAAPKAGLDQMLTEPVIGYSITYPMGVMGVIIAIYLAQYLWKVDYLHEALTSRILGSSSLRLDDWTIRITNPNASRETIHQLLHDHDWNVVFGRAKHDGKVTIAVSDMKLQVGDLITIVGNLADIEKATVYLGEISNDRLDFDRSQLDYRRVFLSNPKVAGMKLRDLRLPQRFGAIVTRVRRGDVEFLPDGDTVLQFGDRIRILSEREDLDEISKYLGDSYRALSEIDVLSFSLGLAIGLALGTVPIPLPGGFTFKLGLAGGPLIVALILGTLGRTGPMVWNLPYSANLTLRQIGLILFLAGIGTRAGYSFFSTLSNGGGVTMFVMGAGITFVTAFLTLWVGHKLLKIPMSILIGMVGGMQTQPAVLGFTLEQTKNDLPNVGYASVYPVAMIVKIIMAQLIMILLH